MEINFLIYYLCNKSVKCELKKRIRIILVILFILIVFLAPYGYHIDLGPGPNGIFAILWDIQVYYGFQIFESLEYFPSYIFRFVVLYEVFRFFNEKISKKRFLLFGIIADVMIPLLIFIPAVLFLSPEGENYLPIMISIPILLAFCIVVVLSWSFSKESN